MRPGLNKIRLTLLLLSVLLGCSQVTEPERRFTAFFEPGSPVLCFGSDDQIKRPGNYESLWTFCVDPGGNVYVADAVHFRVDKFDKNGKYLFSFGGPTHDASRHPGWVDIFAADSMGNLIAYSNARQKFLFFPGNGDPFKTLDINPQLASMTIKKLEYFPGSGLFITGHGEEYGYRVLKYGIDTREYQIIHADNRKSRILFRHMLPDAAVDHSGNIYVTDTVDYRIYKYNKDGQPAGSFSRYMKKNRIKPGDFNLLKRGNRIKRHPNYDQMVKQLKQKPWHFPAIFGIHVGGQRILTWTCLRNEEKQYIVDVYDLDFNYRCSTAYFNAIGTNLATINNRTLYIPNIGSADRELKSHIGRFGLFNIPYKIEAFQISNRLFDDSR
jgi:hypothetical protein